MARVIYAGGPSAGARVDVHGEQLVDEQLVEGGRYVLDRASLTYGWHVADPAPAELVDPELAPDASTEDDQADAMLTTEAPADVEGEHVRPDRHAGVKPPRPRTGTRTRGRSR